jgi:hypothetical protein
MFLPKKYNRRRLTAARRKIFDYWGCATGYEKSSQNVG